MRTYWRRMRHLSPAAARVFRCGLGLCCYLLFCAVLLMLRGQPFSPATYHFFIRAAQLELATRTVFFCTGMLACWIEERSM